MTDNLNNLNDTNEDISANPQPEAQDTFAAEQSPREENRTFEEESYGGFSQKRAWERTIAKQKKKSNAAVVVICILTALLLITLSVVGTVLAMKYFERRTENFNGTNAQNAFENTQNGTQAGKPVSGSIDDKVYYAEDREDKVINPLYTGEVMANQDLIAFASPSVVGIKTQVQGYSYFGTSVYEGVGSGFVITDDGYIVTNYHVIEDAIAIKVILESGNEYEATLVGGDELSDLAVLKIDAHEALQAVIIGDSDKVVAGDFVIAIGCPAGIEFAGTATSGMVSKAKRELSITDSYGNHQKTMYAIQIDAPINPGNSGGPLLNDRGEVIGINTLKLSTSYEGIGFALPINGVMDIVSQLCESGVVTDRGDSSYVRGKAALGITYNDISASEAEYFEVPQGVIVILPTPGGAAQKAGILSGDIIISYDETQIKTSTDLFACLKESAPGDAVDITVWRDGSTKTISVTLGEGA